MKKTNWNDGKSVYPPIDSKATEQHFNRSKCSKTVLVVIPRKGRFGGEPLFGYYNHTDNDWYVNGLLIEMKDQGNIFWCDIPEYSGVMKTIIKKIKRQQNE